MDELFSLENSVDLGLFLGNVESAGGYEFRNQDKPDHLEFSLELVLADHRYSYVSYLNPDTSNHLMWAAVYRWYENKGDNNWEMESEFVRFGDFLTGDLILTDVENSNSHIPESYSLSQNYPNPFNPSTEINYSVPSLKISNEEKQDVSIIVYDLLGNIIEVLVEGKHLPGEYKINFHASDIPSGTYFYQLKTSGYTNTKKMLLLK